MKAKDPLIAGFGARVGGVLTAQLDRDTAQLSENWVILGSKNRFFSPKYLGTGGESKERSGGLK